MLDVHARTVIRRQKPLLILIGVISAIYLLQLLLGGEAFRHFPLVPSELEASWQSLRRGEIGAAELMPFATLLTSAFLHGSPNHLLVNMLFLWIFAALVAELLGDRWMFGIFALSAIGGSLCHALLNAGDPVPMLGASGAVMGFEGAYLGLAVRWRLPNPHIWPMARPVPPSNLVLLAVFGIAFDVSGLMSQTDAGIAYGAHIGGFLVGLFLTSFVTPEPRTI